MRLKGGRTGKRAVVCEDLELTGLMKPFDLEVWYGERVAVLGSNGSGKSHFLRLLAAGGSDPDVEHQPVERRRRSSRSTTPARPSSAPGCARAGSCRPTSTPSWSAARCWRSCTAATDARTAATGWAASRPPGCSTATSSRTPSEQKFESLSGGQQARFQILLLELSGATLLLLDEPTDNLDVQSAEALEDGPGGVRRHRGRGHPRPLVRPRLRPVPGVRRRRRRLRVRRAGLGRGPGAADAMSTCASSTSTRSTRPAFAPFHDVYAAALRHGPAGRVRDACGSSRRSGPRMADPDERIFRIGWAGWSSGRAPWPPAGCRRRPSTTPTCANVLVCTRPRRARPRLRGRRCSPMSRSRPGRGGGTGW